MALGCPFPLPRQLRCPGLARDAGQSAPGTLGMAAGEVLVRQWRDMHGSWSLLPSLVLFPEGPVILPNLRHPMSARVTIPLQS